MASWIVGCMLPSTTSIGRHLTLSVSLQSVILLSLLIICNQQICCGYEAEGGVQLRGGSTNNNSAYLRFVMLHVSLRIVIELLSQGFSYYYYRLKNTNNAISIYRLLFLR